MEAGEGGGREAGRRPVQRCCARNLRRSRLVNEMAPYQGTVIAGRDTIVLVIEAEGPWEIEVTVR